MVRWYDYIAAISLADLMTAFLFAGFNSTVWYEPMWFGLITGLLYSVIWRDLYCQFRKRQENAS